MLKASLTTSIKASSGTSEGSQLGPQRYSPWHLWALQPGDSPLLVPRTATPPSSCGAVFHLFPSATAVQNYRQVCNLAQDCYETQSTFKAKAK